LHLILVLIVRNHQGHRLLAHGFIHLRRLRELHYNLLVVEHLVRLILENLLISNDLLLLMQLTQHGRSRLINLLQTARAAWHLIRTMATLGGQRQIGR
jgi:hypothetical protein